MDSSCSALRFCAGPSGTQLKATFWHAPLAHTSLPQCAASLPQ